MRRKPGVTPAVGPGSAPSPESGCVRRPCHPRGRGGARTRASTRYRLVPAFLLLVPLAACASAPPVPESEAAREVAATRAAAERTAAEAEAADEPPRRSAPERDPVREKLVVVDPGARQTPRTPAELAAAARAERELHGDRSVGELTDENLAEMAARGKVTYAGGKAGDALAAGEPPAGGTENPPAAGSDSAAGAEATAGEVGEAAPEPCGEVCWRRRALELRQGWADAVERVGELEEEVAEQRWRFYATDDPWVRDSRVKPAWDRALDRLRRTRDEADRYRQRVDDLMEEGRRAGALAGWLREGLHLEPTPAGVGEDRDPSEPREPDVLEDYARQPDEPR